MIIFKLFGSIVLLFLFLGLVFVLFSLVIAQSFISDLGKFFTPGENQGDDNDEYINQSSTFKKNTFNMGKQNQARRKAKKSSKNIPTIAQCPKCGTYYAEIPEDGKCSCGEKLK